MSSKRETKRGPALGPSKPVTPTRAKPSNQAPRAAVPSVQGVLDRLRDRAAGPQRIESNSAVHNRMSSAFGVPFSNVAIEATEQTRAKASARGVGAYTDGETIGLGALSTEDDTAMRTIAHEFAHVAQAKGGTAEAPPPENYSVRSSPDLEAEAHTAADDVVANRRPRVSKGRWSGEIGEGPKRSKSGGELPARGTFYAQPNSDASWTLTFHTKDVLEWGGLLEIVFVSYATSAFPGATAAMAKAFLADTKIHFEGDPVADAKEAEDKNESLPFHFDIDKELHDKLAKFLSDKYKIAATPTPKIKEGSHALPPKPGGGTGSGTKKKEGRPGGTGDGTPGGIVKFEPKAELILGSKQPTYVKGSTLPVKVQFDAHPVDQFMINIFPFKADFDWTIWRDSDVVDNGPLLEAMGGAIDYDVDLDEVGDYLISVTVSSRHFKDDKKLHLTSPLITVKEEEDVSAEYFEGSFVGPEQHKPFETDADGNLKVKKGERPISIQEEIALLDTRIGAVRGSDFPEAEKKAYIEYFEKQKEALRALEKSEAKNSPYIIHATFIARDDSTRFPLSLHMFEQKSKRSGDKYTFSVLLHDTSMGGSKAPSHPGAGIAQVAGDESAARRNAELTAIGEMLSHLHWNNSYPDGTIEFGIQLHSTGEVIRQTVKTVAVYSAAIGGVVLLAASPFTGGATAPVGIVILEGVAFTAAAAGTITSVAIGVQERVTTGTFAWDRTTALDVLAVASLGLGGIGSFTKLFQSFRAVGTAGYVGVMAGIDVTSFVFITLETREAMEAIEAQYGAMIAEATDPLEKERLKKERDSKLAQQLGTAAVSGGFMLVSLAGGVVQVKSALSRRTLDVHPEVKILGEKGSAAEIRTHLDNAKPTAAERTYLEEALKVRIESEVAATPGPDGSVPVTPKPVVESPPVQKPKPATEAPPAAKKKPEGTEAPPSATKKPEGTDAPPPAKKPEGTGEEPPVQRPKAMEEAPPAKKPEGTADEPPIQKPKATEAPPVQKPKGATEEPPLQKPKGATEEPPLQKPKAPAEVTPAPTASEAAEAIAKTNEVAKKGLEHLNSLFTGKGKVQQILDAVPPDKLEAFLVAMNDPSLTTAGLGLAGFYVPVARNPALIDFINRFGAKLMTTMYRRLGWSKKMGDAIGAVQTKYAALAPDDVAQAKLLTDLEGASSKKKLLDLLGLSPPKKVKKAPTKKSMGIDRSSATWKRIRAAKAKQNTDHGHGLTDDQLDVWSDLTQAKREASRGAFSGLGDASKREIIARYDKLGRDAGLPTPWVNSLRGDMAEWLFNPGRGLAKPVFKGGSKVTGKTPKGSTIPDYGQPAGGSHTEWVNQKSDFIDRGGKSNGVFKSGVNAARVYRGKATTEAANLPAGDKYSLDFIFDPGPKTRAKMLQILFDAGSPIHRVKFGDTWYTAPP